MESYGQIRGKLSASSPMITGSPEKYNPNQNDAASEAEVPAPIHNAFNMVSGSREQIYALVQELERKISAVLRPVGPSAGQTGKDNPTPSRSGLTEALHLHAGQLHDIAAQLSNIIDRVEL